MSEQDDAGTGKVMLAWLPSPIGGIPCLQQGFFDSIFQFLHTDAAGRNVFGGYTFATTGYIASGRDSLVTTFLDKTTAEWLLMLDWDVHFTPDDVYMLLDAADPVDKPIISGCYVTYFGADNALRPCWMEDIEGLEYVPSMEFRAGEIVPLTVCGMGFTLMHRSALETIAKMHPAEPWKWFGHDVVNGERVGEDVTFCKRARDAGLTVWGHGGVMLGHMKSKILVAEDMLNPVFAVSHTPRVNKTVLSIGAGGVKECIGFEGWNVVTLDIDEKTKPDILMDARDVFNPPGVSWTMALPGINERSPEDSTYDAVYSSHSIEHFTHEDAGLVLRGMLRVLKPDGHVIIRCPDVAEVQEHLDSGKNLDDQAYKAPVGPITYRDILEGYSGEVKKKGNDYYRHLSGYTKESLEELLVNAGFEDVEVGSHKGSFELEAKGVKRVKLEVAAGIPL